MITELTQSLLNQMARCPYQVYLTRVKGILIPPGVAARKGSAVHKGAEYIHREKLRGIDTPIDNATDATRDEFVSLVENEGVFLTDDEKAEQDTILNTGLNEAVSCVRTYRNHVSPSLGKIALIEERLYADVGAGIPLSGKPDLVVDGVLDDIKTSGKRWANGMENLTLQPTMYRLLLKANDLPVLRARYTILSNMKKEPKDIDKDYDTVIWDENELVVCDRRETNRTDADEQKLIYRVQAVADQIRSGNFPPGQPDQWWCTKKFCAFHGTICKYT